MEWHTALTDNHIYKENLITDYIQGFKGPVRKGKTGTDMHFGMQRKADWNLLQEFNMLCLTESKHF